MKEARGCFLSRRLRAALVAMFPRPRAESRLRAGGPRSCARSMRPTSCRSDVSFTADTRLEAARASVSLRADCRASWLQRRGGPARASVSRVRARVWAHLLTGDWSERRRPRAHSLRSHHVLAPCAEPCPASGIHGPDSSSAGTVRPAKSRCPTRGFAPSCSARSRRSSERPTIGLTVALRVRAANAVALAGAKRPLGSPFGGFARGLARLPLSRCARSSRAPWRCFSTALEPSSPRTFGAGPAAWTQAAESDWLHAVHAARRTGLSVVLLPQLLSSEHGGWAGQVLLRTPENRRFLFDGWARFLESAGLAAERGGRRALARHRSPDAASTRALPSTSSRAPVRRAARRMAHLDRGRARRLRRGLTYAGALGRRGGRHRVLEPARLRRADLFALCRGGSTGCASESEFATGSSALRSSPWWDSRTGWARW